MRKFHDGTYLEYLKGKSGQSGERQEIKKKPRMIFSLGSILKKWEPFPREGLQRAPHTELSEKEPEWG